MKSGILTFHFAHNYGAVLQAYALKYYLNSIGRQAKIISFVPLKLQNEYSLNPFARKASLKNTIKRWIRIPLRVRQYRLFDDFIKNVLLGEDDEEEYSEVFFGSDQIWNESITGEIENYYGLGISKKAKWIAYAASFGTNQLSDFQKNCVKKYIPSFDQVSLRESDVISEVSQLSGKDVISVLDPVFLLNEETWDEFSKKAKGAEKNYILYYALRNDQKLIEQTESIAKKLKCKIICIHPTCNDLKTKWIQLYNVGPYEFVKLIKNATLVSTNSFHAIAFSIIFGKKVVYKSYSNTESRIPSILKICGLLNQYGPEVCTFDFSQINRENLEKEKEKSYRFIQRALQQ